MKSGRIFDGGLSGYPATRPEKFLTEALLLPKGRAKADQFASMLKMPPAS